MKVLVTTFPFDAKIPFNNVITNTKGAKYTQTEIQRLLEEHNPDIIIAGTEKYGKEEFNLCSNLKVISRVGIGTSSIDLEEASKRNIVVHNTPDAPTTSVAELTLMFILSLLRKSNQQEMWKKVQGREISECVVGIVGYGRIGREVHRLLSVFNPKEVLIYDPQYNNSVDSIDVLYGLSDIITLHTPYLDQIISKTQLNIMRENAILVNTSRGTLLDQKALIDVLKRRTSMSAGLDVFEIEPFDGGEFKDLSNVILTPHIGSFTVRARVDMENQAVDNIKQYLN